MTLTVGIKVFFGIMAAAIYSLGAQQLYAGATNTVGYAPNDFTEWLVTAAAAALIAFIAAQIGVTVGQAEATWSGRFRSALFGSTTLSQSQRNASVALVVILIADLLVLTYFGVQFIRLSLSPDLIKVQDPTNPLKDAPDYVTLQAKSYLALVFAGAGGVTAGALKG